MNCNTSSKRTLADLDLPVPSKKIKRITADLDASMSTALAKLMLVNLDLPMPSTNDLDVLRATKTIKRALISYMYEKRKAEEFFNELSSDYYLHHDASVEVDVQKGRMMFKRFYPMKYRLSMMKLALGKVLRGEPELYDRVAQLIDDARPIYERFNEFVDLLSLRHLIFNGW